MCAEFEGWTEAINGLESGIWLRTNISIKIIQESDLQKLNFTCFFATTVISIILITVVPHIILHRRSLPILAQICIIQGTVV
jgi:hypothetical protein